MKTQLTGLCYRTNLETNRTRCLPVRFRGATIARVAACVSGCSCWGVLSRFPAPQSRWLWRGLRELSLPALLRFFDQSPFGRSLFLGFRSEYVVRESPGVCRCGWYRIGLSFCAVRVGVVCLHGDGAAWPVCWHGLAHGGTSSGARKGVASLSGLVRGGSGLECLVEI